RSVRGALAYRVGLYHYAQPTPAPETQAEVLIGEVRRLGTGDLWPALDLEGAFLTMPISDAIDFAKRFLLRTARDCDAAMLYANTSFLSRLSPEIWQMPWLRIWAANYGVSDGRRYPLPTRWASAAAHQFTDRLVVPGIPGYVDGDWTNDLNNL